MTLRELSRRPEVKIVCSIALLFIAYRFLNWRNLTDAALRLDPWHLCVGFVGALFVLLFSAARWALMACELDPGAFPRHFRNYLFGIFLGIVTPANIGADLYRFGSFPKTGGAWPIVSLLLREKVFILLGYLISIVLTLVSVALVGPMLTRDQGLVLTAVGLSAAGGTILIFALHPLTRLLEGRRIVSGRLMQLLSALQSVAALGTAKQRLALTGLSLLSVLAWLCGVSAIAAAVGGSAPLLLLWLIAILADVARWMPLSLQGIGVREAAFAAMFAFFGADAAQGFVIGATAYVLLTAAMVAAGALALGIDLATSLGKVPNPTLSEADKGGNSL
jgi:glycosyltransferase 2 family protein